MACARRGVGHAGRTSAVWRGYSASESFAALVRDIVHHINARWDTLRGLTAYMGWSSVVGAWVCALVAQQRRSWRTTFARKVSSVSEKTPLGSSVHTLVEDNKTHMTSKKKNYKVGVKRL